MEVCLIKLLFARIVWCDCLWEKRSFIQPLSQVKCQRQRIKGKAVLHTTSPSRLRRASSPSRGALGKAMQFVLLTAAAWHTTRTKRSGTPEAPLLGELSNEVRLRGCTEQRLSSTSLRVAAPSVCFGPWCGPRILLAAAPTAPPCFRRWRRSSLLHLLNWGASLGRLRRPRDA